jgi:WRKY transcription factor 22
MQLKGCAARKRVERAAARTPTLHPHDLTYTGEHNHVVPTHCNSLTDSTRHKFPSSTTPPSSVVVGGADTGVGRDDS